MNYLIKLATAGADTGPFNIYSDVDGYTTPFLSLVSKDALVVGVPTTDVPIGTVNIRILSSNGVCQNYWEGPVSTTTTTTTPTP